MSRVQQLLAGARMVGGGQVPRDAVPYDGGPARSWPPPSAVDRKEREGERQAGIRLVGLCEAVLACHAETALRSFVTDRLPNPLGARLVGCVLQLADDEDGARAWWQYAAGADDTLSPYCLHLQHRKYGEREAAAWWLERGQSERRSVWGERGGRPSYAFDVTVPELMDLAAAGVRSGARARAAVVEALFEYIPAAVAVGHDRHPAFDLPVPDAGFMDRVRSLLASSAVVGQAVPPPGADGPARLPVRQRAKGRPAA